MKTIHTPTPWAVNPDGEYNEHGSFGINIDMESGSLKSLATTWGESQTDCETAKADAQFIVTAVNSHEANVKRIEELEAVLKLVAVEMELRESLGDPILSFTATLTNKVKTAINPA